MNHGAMMRRGPTLADWYRAAARAYAEARGHPPRRRTVLRRLRGRLRRLGLTA